MLYKQHSITHKIPSGKFQISDLKKFIELANKIHEDCIKQLKHDIISKEFSYKEIDANNPTEVDAKIAKNFKIMIEIFGDDGEYVNVLNLNEITSEVDLPHKFSRMRIGNCSIFEYNFTLKPSIYFETVIDFRSTRIFDLISAPSRSTANDSHINISGQNSTVVHGISGTLEKFFDRYRSHHGFLHQENIYDLLLWLGFFPLLLVYLFKYQSKIPEFVTSSSTLAQVLAALTSFFIFALSFRLIFNLGRWLFPYMEVKDQTGRERTALKAIYSLAITAIIGSIVVHFGNFLWETLIR